MRGLVYGRNEYYKQGQETYYTTSAGWESKILFLFIIETDLSYRTNDQRFSVKKGFDVPENKQNIDWEKFKWLKSYNLEKKARIHDIKSQIENLIKEKGYFFRNYGSEWDCQDIELLKKIYEAESSYNATKNSLENIGIESVPSRKTLYRMVRRSFKSEENYKNWKNQAKVKIFHRITSKEET